MPWWLSVAGATSLAARVACVCARAGTLLGLANLESPASEVGAVQRLGGAHGVCARHLDETKAARATGVAIVDQGELFNGTVRREQGAYGILGGGKGKISNV
jgi:hypothetical protein